MNHRHHFEVHKLRETIKHELVREGLYVRYGFILVIYEEQSRWALDLSLTFLAIHVAERCNGSPLDH
jgi:hypothetical protein